MKKIIYLVLITGGIHSISAMDQEGRRGSGFFCVPYGQQEDDQRADHQGEQAQEVNLGIVDLFFNARNWFVQTMNAVDQAVGGGVAEQEAQQAALAPHIKVVQEALAKGTLPQAIERSAKEQSPNRFLSLLIGMHHLGIQPTNDSISVIQQRLQALKLANRQETQRIIEERRVQEQKLHDLRKRYFAKAALSDDEDYKDMPKFIDSVLNDEK